MNPPATVPALAALALTFAAPVTRADEVAATTCTGVTDSGGRFATCFDLGNRLVIAATSDGVGAGVLLRHQMRFDDEPDLTWKLEHELASGAIGVLSGRHTGVVYSGRYLRHARDGHIVLPFSVDRKVFLPFDIGAEVEAGRLSARSDDARVDVGVVRTAALVDWGRSRSFRRRLAIGVAARWDVEADRDRRELSRHVVAPFSTAMASAHAESATGLTAGDAHVEGGNAWASDTGWRGELAARASVERVVIAVNDRPLSIYSAVAYSSVRGELAAEIGVRFAIVQRLDPRVSR
jgi:hypothetical protein